MHRFSNQSEQRGDLSLLLGVVACYNVIGYHSIGKVGRGERLHIEGQEYWSVTSLSASPDTGCTV